MTNAKEKNAYGSYTENARSRARIAYSGRGRMCAVKKRCKYLAAAEMTAYITGNNLF